ncbi:MAG: tyrosine-type recombinase/integrase [Epsilonproteobacteria bacterium]|nr:tyrosine-type recombinase/integrase [Campylobacterota bacterium]
MKNSKTYTKKLVESLKEEFLQYLLEFKGYSELTVKTYENTLRDALTFLELDEKEHTTVWNLMPYRLHIATQNPKTISKKLSAVRSFVDFLHKKGISIILNADESIKIPKTLPKPISQSQIKEALKSANELEKLVIVMLYSLGLRISELQNIRLQDISQEWIRITGKGNKQRDIPILKHTKKLIDQFIEKNNPKIYLFEKNGEKLSQNSLRYLINKSFSRIGLKVTPHQLRHSFATSLLNQGASIADVSELLGHKSMATTQIYTKLGNNLKKENYLQSHPLCSGEI